MTIQKFKIGQEVYGIYPHTSKHTKRRFVIISLFYDSLTNSWIYGDKLGGHWKSKYLRDINNVIFCAECGEEEFPNCGVNISSLGSESIKLHWECYFKNVNEGWQLKRRYSDNSEAVIVL